MLKILQRKIVFFFYQASLLFHLFFIVPFLLNPTSKLEDALSLSLNFDWVPFSFYLSLSLSLIFHRLSFRNLASLCALSSHPFVATVPLSFSKVSSSE